MLKKSIVFGSCLLILFAAASGCGKKVRTHDPNRTTVKGKLSLDGKPLPGGSLKFVSIKDPMYSIMCSIKNDGSFDVGDAPLGEVKVAISTEEAKMSNADGYFPVPQKYRDPETSGITLTIANDKDKDEGMVWNYDLKSK